MAAHPTVSKLLWHYKKDVREAFARAPTLDAALLVANDLAVNVYEKKRMEKLRREWPDLAIGYFHPTLNSHRTLQTTRLSWAGGTWFKMPCGHRT